MLVYAVQQGPGGPVKIGHTRDLRHRLSALQNGSPVPLTVLATWPGARDLERELHQEHAEARLSGEWFSPEIVPALLRRGGTVEVCLDRRPRGRPKGPPKPPKPKLSPEEARAISRENGKLGGRPRNVADPEEAARRKAAVRAAIKIAGSMRLLAAKTGVLHGAISSYATGRRTVPDSVIALLVEDPPLRGNL